MTKPSAGDLKRIPIFAQLSRADLSLLAENLTVQDVAAGAVVLEEGQANTAFFVLQDGEIEVVVKGEPRRTLRPGAFFGEISLEHAVPVTASLIARTPATAYAMTADDYKRLQANTDAVMRIRATMTDRQAADRLFGSSDSSPIAG